jgi:hypothetical protein
VFAIRAAAALPAAAAIANAACVTGRNAKIEAAASAGAPGAVREVLRAALRMALGQLRRGPRPAQVLAPQARSSVKTPPALAIDMTLAAAVVGHGVPAVPRDCIHYTLTVPNGTASTLTALVATAALDARGGHRERPEPSVPYAHLQPGRLLNRHPGSL